MVLTGKASLAKGRDRISADRIVYDTLNARIKGESVAVKTSGSDGGASKPGRVSITIAPKKRCADGTRRKTCPE